MGIRQSVDAQPLDGESGLREEGGNEAVDADPMWEEVAGWNKMGGELQSSTEVLTDDKVEDVVVGVVTDGTTTESGSSVGSWTFISQLDSMVSSAETLGTSLGGVASGDLLPPPVVVGVLTSGADSLVSSDMGSTGRSGVTDEESPAGKDGESIKETELDGLRTGERDSRDPSVFEHEEEKIRRSSAEAAILEPGGSSNLSADVSSFGGGGNIANGGDGGASSSPSRPMDRRRLFPNPASGVVPDHLTYFRFCGRVIAVALMHRVQVDVAFAVTFFKQLAGLPISWEDA